MEVNAVLRASAGLEDRIEPDRPTLELRALDGGAPGVERSAPAMPPYTGQARSTRPTVRLRARTAEQPPPLARGSEPILPPRGARRSREMLHVDDIRRGGDGAE